MIDCLPSLCQHLCHGLANAAGAAYKMLSVFVSNSLTKAIDVPVTNAVLDGILRSGFKKIFDYNRVKRSLYNDENKFRHPGSMQSYTR